MCICIHCIFLTILWKYYIEMAQHICQVARWDTACSEKVPHYCWIKRQSTLEVLQHKPLWQCNYLWLSIVSQSLICKENCKQDPKKTFHPEQSHSVTIANSFVKQGKNKRERVRQAIEREEERWEGQKLCCRTHLISILTGGRERERFSLSQFTLHLQWRREES